MVKKWFDHGIKGVLKRKIRCCAGGGVDEHNCIINTVGGQGSHTALYRVSEDKQKEGSRGLLVNLEGNREWCTLHVEKGWKPVAGGESNCRRTIISVRAGAEDEL